MDTSSEHPIEKSVCREAPPCSLKDLLLKILVILMSMLGAHEFVRKLRLLLNPGSYLERHRPVIIGYFE